MGIIEKQILARLHKKGATIAENAITWSTSGTQIIWATVMANSRIATLVVPSEYIGADPTRVAPLCDAIDACVSELTR